jgi:hypothetical protein
MKKLLVLTLVLGITQVSWSDSIPLAVMQVAPANQKDHYVPSDHFTIQVVADFPVGMLGIDYVYGPPTASAPVLNAAFTQSPLFPGTVVNSGGVLIKTIAGGIADYPEIQPGQVLWQFEYHMPDVPFSTYITISAVGVAIGNLDYSTYVESIVPLTIHLIPEPATIALLGLGAVILRRKR